MEQTRRARLTGLMAALLTVAAILWTLFASPSIGVVADGSYASAAEGLALRYAEESIPTGQRVEDFAYEDTAYSTLLFASRTSVGAAVALVRLATHPFGLGFSTRYLAVVYALLMGWGAYLLANGLARRSRTAAILATLGLPLALANPAVIGYLNSLYAVGASMAYLLLFLGATVYCLCREKGCGVQWTLLVLFAAQLMLRTMAQMMVLLPAAVLAVVMCAVHSCPGRAERPLHAACVLIASLMSVSGLVTGWQADDTVHSAAANYLAVFQGYLPASEKPEETLEALGLPESYFADIGKSYYEPSENFVNDPRDAENAALLNENISLGKRVKFAIQHPAVVRTMMDKNESALRNADSWYLADDAGNTVSSRSPLHTVLETIFGRDHHAISRWCLICAALLVLLLPIVRRQSASVMLCAFLLMVLLGTIGYLPLTLVLTGGIDLLTVKPLAFLLGGLMVLVSFASGAVVLRRLMAWLSVKEAKLALPPCSAGASGGLLAYLRKIRMTQKGTVAIVAMVCVVLCCWQLLPAEHIGGVNNGDFGRMMEQIDLYWAQPQLDDESTQFEWGVVEDYSYREPFHPARLTSIDPTYSLIFPSMLVRFITLLDGRQLLHAGAGVHPPVAGDGGAAAARARPVSAAGQADAPGGADCCVYAAGRKLPRMVQLALRRNDDSRRLDADDCLYGASGADAARKPEKLAVDDSACHQRAISLHCQGADGAGAPGGDCPADCLYRLSSSADKKAADCVFADGRAAVRAGQLRHAWRVPQKSGGVRKADHLAERVLRCTDDCRRPGRSHGRAGHSGGNEGGHRQTRVLSEQRVCLSH